MWSYSFTHGRRVCHYCCYAAKYAEDRRDYDILRRAHGIVASSPLYALPLDKRFRTSLTAFPPKLVVTDVIRLQTDDHEGRSSRRKGKWRPFCHTKQRRLSSKQVKTRAVPLLFDEAEAGTLFDETAGFNIVDDDMGS